MFNLNVRISNRLRALYVGMDFATSVLALFLFNTFRWSVGSTGLTLGEFFCLPKVIGGMVVFPLALMFIYWLSGYYEEVRFRSRAGELLTTLSSALCGSLVIFFFAVVNDSYLRRSIAFENVFIAAALIFGCVYAGRIIITRTVVKRVHNRLSSDRAIMIGTDPAAVELATRINTLRKGMGISVDVFLHLSKDAPVDPRCLETGVIERDRLREYCAANAVNNLILTPRALNDRMNFAEFIRLAHEQKGSLYVSPDVNTIAFASGRHFNVVGEPLVCISSPRISHSTANFKRTMDVVGSALAILLLSPLFIFVACLVKLDSPGPVFFKQTRLGRGGKPFKIIKFRSMVQDAEPQGRPMVTTDNDPRITRAGRVLRKYRIDELPQFWNVLRGEMSLVGPRPERREFAEQIAARVPLYPMLYQVRPGITSWGMVRYGYASTVDQMVERLRYDLIYLENISIFTDIKILLHTINTVVSGRGK